MSNTREEGKKTYNRKNEDKGKAVILSSFIYHEWVGITKKFIKQNFTWRERQT